MSKSTTRLILYILIALVGTFSQGLKPDMTPFQLIQLVLLAVSASLIVARAFIDQTTSQEQAEQASAPQGISGNSTLGVNAAVIVPAKSGESGFVRVRFLVFIAVAFLLSLAFMASFSGCAGSVSSVSAGAGYNPSTGAYDGTVSIDFPLPTGPAASGLKK